MKLAVSTFSPGSLFGKALLINKDARINFEVNYSRFRTKASATTSKRLCPKKR
jgi:hypothetical protein